jgi:hypothetical protein
MTELVVPITIWHGPPSIKLSGILVSPDKKRVVTCSQTGTLCLWGFREPGVAFESPAVKEKAKKENPVATEAQLEPLFVLTGGHDSPITTIISIVYDFSPAFLSGSPFFSLASRISQSFLSLSLFFSKQFRLMELFVFGTLAMENVWQRARNCCPASQWLPRCFLVGRTLPVPVVTRILKLSI